MLKFRFKGPRKEEEFKVVSWKVCCQTEQVLFDNLSLSKLHFPYHLPQYNKYCTSLHWQWLRGLGKMKIEGATTGKPLLTSVCAERNVQLTTFPEMINKSAEYELWLLSPQLPAPRTAVSSRRGAATAAVSLPPLFSNDFIACFSFSTVMTLF